MKKILLAITLILNTLNAQQIKAGYDVSFGLFGEIGKAEISYNQENDNYLILVHAWTTGMSAALTQNREESYISQGTIINNTLRPDVFVKFRQSDNYTKINVFKFDHKEKKVLVHYTKEHKGTRTQYDVHSMKNVKEEISTLKVSQENFRLYTDNDLLSLFFNTKKILPTLQEGETRSLTAIGSKNPNCEIDINVPCAQKKEALQEIMQDDKGRLLTIILHQDIFQSKDGELNVIFDEEGLAKNVLLRDVILFGDIRGKRTYLEK